MFERKLYHNFVCTNGCTASVNTVVDSVFTMYLDLGAKTLCSGSSLVLKPNHKCWNNWVYLFAKGSLDNDVIKNPTASPTDTTVYTLTAKWGICQLTDNVKINVLRKPVANAGTGAVICYDGTVQYFWASATNLSGTVNYLWSPANLLETKLIQMWLQ